MISAGTIRFCPEVGYIKSGSYHHGPSMHSPKRSCSGSATRTFGANATPSAPVSILPLERGALSTR